MHKPDCRIYMNEIAKKRKIYDVTLKGAVINILLLISKFIAGIWGHSSAIMADAVHSFSDLLTDIIVLVSVKLGGKPKDKSHDYGYGKAATVSAAVLGIILLFISLVFIHLTSLFNLIDHLMQFFFCNWFFRNGLLEHFSHTST